MRAFGPQRCAQIARLECRTARAHVGAKMGAQRTAVAVDQDLEIASRLRCLDDAERVPLSRHLQIDGVVARNLEEHARVRARPCTPGRSSAGSAGQTADTSPRASRRERQPHGLQGPLVRLVHLDVRQHRKIVAFLEPVEMRLRDTLPACDPTSAARVNASAFFSSVNSLTPSPVKIGVSAGNAPFASYSVVSFRVAILLASTSGWSNGCRPRREPATAVANSQRKNSAPRSYGSSAMRTTGCPARSSASTELSCSWSGADRDRRYTKTRSRP